MVKLIPSRERNKIWANGFLEKLERTLNKSGKTIEIELSTRKNRYRILKPNMRSIVDYAKYKMNFESVKPYSVTRYANYLLYFADFVKKPFRDVKREDIERYINHRVKIKNSEKYLFMLKITVKSFFKWFYKFDEDYPDVVKWMKCKPPKNNNLSSKCIEMEEILKMMDACDNPRDKALISILYESGARISELLDLRIGNVEFDVFGAKLIVDGKTGERKIRVCQYAGDLKNWLNNHPFKNDKNAPFFCSFQHRSYGGYIHTSSGWAIVSKIAKRAGIKHNIHPHMFRHTRATELSLSMKDMSMKIHFGWSLNSNMPALYSHLTDEDVDDEILAMSNIIRPKEKPKTLTTFKCYRCQEINNPTNKFCWKCEAPLTDEAIKQAEKYMEVLPLLHELLKLREIDARQFDELSSIFKGKNENKGGNENEE